MQTEKLQQHAQNIYLGGVEELERLVEIKRLVDVYYDVQDVRIRTANRLRSAMPSKAETEHEGELKRIETKIKNEIETHIENIPIYTRWLKHVKGVGPCIAGSLIGNLAVKFIKVDKLEECTEIERKYALKTKNKKYLIPAVRRINEFTNVAKLWRYCGQGVTENGIAECRKKGKTISYNPTMKVLCWKIGESFVKQKNSFYREQYEQFRKHEDEHWTIEKESQYIAKRKRLGYIKKTFKPEKAIKAHRFARSKRKTIKMFLAHLFDKWWKLDGLEPPKPYAFSFLGHSGYVEAPSYG